MERPGLLASDVREVVRRVVASKTFGVVEVQLGETTRSCVQSSKRSRRKLERHDRVMVQTLR